MRRSRVSRNRSRSSGPKAAAPPPPPPVPHPSPPPPEAVEERQDQRHLAGAALVGQEDPVEGGGQVGTDVEAPHAVVGHGPRQRLPEARRQPLAVGIERAEVGAEVLAGALGGVVVGRPLPPVPREAAQVGEGRHHRQLGPEEGVVGAVEQRPVGLVPGEQVPGLGGVEVEALDVGGDGLEPLLAPDAGVARRRADHRVEGDPRPGRRRRVALRHRFEPHQRRTGVDLHVGGHVELAHAPGRRRRDGHLHLHGLDQGQPVARRHHVVGGHEHGDDHRRRRRPHQPAVVARQPVGGTVDLDDVLGTVGPRHDAVGPPAEGQPAAEPGQALTHDVDHVTVDLDPEPALRPSLGDPDGVGGTGVAELDHPADVTARLGAAPAGRGQEPGDLPCGLGVVGVDRRRRHGHRPEATVGRQLGDAAPVEPAGVDPAVDHLGPVEQVEQERLVGHPAPHHHGQVEQGPLEPGPGLVPVVAPHDHLGDHRVELGRDDVALGDARVDADAGAGREGEELDRPRRRGEVAPGVLGVEAGLDGVPELGRRPPGQPAAPGDVQLQLHEVEPGGQLGDGVLDLQPGVHLQEGEQLLVGLVEELDGPGAAVADAGAQALGGTPQLVLLLLRQDRRPGLLDHLLVAALDAAIADAERPRGAVAVGDDLHLDVTGVPHLALQEDRRVAERPARLGPGALEGAGQLGVARHQPDAPAPAAGGRLHHERVADDVGVAAGLLHRRHRPAAPRGHRHPRLLGQELGGDLVAQLAHHARAGAEEGNAQVLAPLDEVGVLGDEPPARPHGVGTGVAERPLEQVVVEVRVHARRGHRRAREVVEADRLVGLRHEQGAPLGPGVQGDRPQIDTVLTRVLPGGVDQPHGGLAPVHDGQTTERPPSPARLHPHGHDPVSLAPPTG
jgi:hypothetical protein